jgi:hypothetical protein
MSFYTSTHLIVGQETGIKAEQSERGAWLLLSDDHRDHRICLSLLDADAVDRLLDALSEAHAFLVGSQTPALAVVGGEQR